MLPFRLEILAHCGRGTGRDGRDGRGHLKNVSGCQGRRGADSASITLSRLQILALDTTSREGSVAVVRDGVLIHQHRGDPRVTHGERLPGDMMRALNGAGIGAGDLDLLAVAVGPGSFTGLRVGVAAVQGLALARGLSVVPVPTLEALARGVASAFRRKEDDPPVELIAPWMDGQRGEVFAALYEVLPPNEELPPKGGSHGGSHEIHSPIAAPPDVVLDAWQLCSSEAPVVFIGDGAVRYRDLLAARLGTRARILEPPPLAAIIARIAFDEPHRAVEPHAIVPLYVRRPDAELARERRETRGSGARAAEPDKRQV